ncbi:MULTISPECIES: WhiB family transcriptional regulator [unclassified Streptomyces]|uniref:WhiB family transcriptional regulator n=1 Tax=unclassified Streptomyces TaxID=2593676 RepID=UPI002E16DC34|nr:MULTISPECIES: WhiB family transcriptional regulator [unclassified Streptomyces]
MIRHTVYPIAAPDGLDPKERWQDRGACRSAQYRNHADLWYAHSRDRDAVNTARRICNACPVRAECLEYALERREQAAA